MKKFLTQLLERVANAFRDLDYGEERQKYLRNYAEARSSMLYDRKQDMLPVASEEAMRLDTSVVRHIMRLGDSLYAVHVWDNGEAYAQVYGKTAMQAVARAEQLVSALDGARRL